MGKLLSIKAYWETQFPCIKCYDPMWARKNECAQMIYYCNNKECIDFNKLTRLKLADGTEVITRDDVIAVYTHMNEKLIKDLGLDDS